MKHSRLVAMLSIALLNPVLADQETTPRLAQMDKIFSKYLHVKGPGCAVALITDGKVVFKKAYGMANLDYNQQITSASVFDIASLTKQFTGLAISTLVEQGKLSLSDDIRKYLPDVPDFGRVITVAHLIHHTSGLRDYPEALQMAGWRYGELFTLEDVMRFVRHQKELDFEPGERYSYSNTGYVLLAVIVEKVTGQSFPVWLRENVFAPLQMKTSFITTNCREITQNLATSYVSTDQGFLRCPDLLSAYGSSCMYSSLDDLTTWVIHFQNKLREKDSIYLRMLDPGILNKGERVNYGFGLNLDEYRGLRQIWHSGAWAGYRTIIIHYPEQRFGLVVLCNAGDNDISGPYVRQIAEAYLKESFVDSDEKEIEKVKSLPTVKLEMNQLQKYAGTFASDDPGGPHIRFAIEQGELVGHNGPTTFPMQAKGNSCFYLPADKAIITFPTEGGQQGDTFVFKGSSIMKRHHRESAIEVHEPKFMPTAQQLEVYVGSYYSGELDTSYHVDLLEGKLMVHQFRRGDCRLDPNADAQNQFKGEMGTFDFYMEASKVVGFKLTGEKVRNMRFVKKS